MKTTTPRHLLLAAFTFTCAAALLSAAEAEAEPRVALVIGNSAYAGRPLKNPAHDARALSATLRSLGFDVTEAHDLDQKAMRHAIADFGAKLKDGAVGLFYYAGHGMQINGRNYLIPTQVTLRSESDVQIEAVDANEVLLRMEEAGNPLNIVILDACRDNPFQRRFRSAAGGLAFMDAPNGTLIAYATSPGRVASDGEGANSTYTEALVQYMLTPGLRVEDVFKRVRTQVRERTDGAQVPWESSSLEGDFYFAAAQAEGTCPPGMQREGNRCVPLISTACPQGTSFQAGKGCVPVVQSAPLAAAGPAMPPELLNARKLPAQGRSGVDAVSALAYGDLPVPEGARLLTRTPEALALYIDAQPAEIAAFYYARMTELCGPSLEMFPNPYGYTFRAGRMDCPLVMASVVQTNGNLITQLTLKQGTVLAAPGDLGVYGEHLPPNTRVRLVNNNLITYQTLEPVEKVVEFYNKKYTNQPPELRLNPGTDPTNARRPTLQISSRRPQEIWQSIYVKVHPERQMTGKDSTEIIVSLKPPAAP